MPSDRSIPSSTDSPSTTDSAPTPDDRPAVLDREQHHLAVAREALRRMRERVESLDVSASTADWVSQLYLKSTIGIRIDQLAELPSTPLFFGRLDYRPDSATGSRELPHRPAPRRRRRRPPSWSTGGLRSACRSTAPPRAMPMGVGLRRRFAFTGGDLTASRTSRSTDRWTVDRRRGSASHILTDEIERPRVGPMRDIVATIQPEQDEIVRADLGDTVCVQGAPGTGKTAVGLHRAAFLLYAHRDQLRRQRLLVIGPNDAFLRYIADVLPALGEVDASQTTIDDLLVGRVRGPRRRRTGRSGRHAQGRRADGDRAAPGAVVAARTRRPGPLEVPRG